ncbi:MAG: IgGFc-binding protein, partial [Myxococcales bacterium]|nr:IgGFc-binding protein [Myxococcales bacterium]
TNDASLLLPIGALGTVYRNVGVPAWETADQDRDGNPVEGPGFPATLTVIGTQPGTRVTVTLPAGVQVDEDPTQRSQRNGQVLSAVLGDSEVWTIEARQTVRVGNDYIGQDLSGARVEATAPVAVFTGHQCTYYPQDSAACDHLEEQLFPVDAWGAQFLLTPPKLRSPNPALARETTYWKLVADTDATVVTLGVPFADLSPAPPGAAGVPDCGARLTGPDQITLQAGEFCEFGSRRPVAVQASAPVQIMGIMSGQATVGFNFDPAGQNAGDPAIWIVPPQRQFRRSYAFLAPDTYYVDYVTVVAPVGTELTLDGQPVDMIGAERVAGADGFFVQAIEIEDGPHRIEGSAPFGILVYAYDDYVSYAFTGGLDLSKR